MSQKDYLRIGKISSYNYEKGTASITYEDKNSSTTAQMSLLAWQYWLPKVGDQVLVAHLSNGTCAAVILGPVWHDGHRPPEGFDGLFRKEYNNQTGKAYERYDANAEEYSKSITGSVTIKPTEFWRLEVGSVTIQANKDGSITIDAPKGITVNTPTFTVSGEVLSQNVSLPNHTHTGDSGGSTSKPN